jgi:hypothetical protein
MVCALNYSMNFVVVFIDCGKTNVEPSSGHKYTLFNKNQAAWNFVCSTLEVT